jgi:hypothetical protein
MHLRESFHFYLKLSLTCTLLGIISAPSSFAQAVSDEALKEFWEETIPSFTQRDTVQLNDVIEFPMLGFWPMFMGLPVDDPTQRWTKDRVFENLDVLLPDDLIESFKKQSSADIEISTSLGYTELLVRYDRSSPLNELEVSEGSLIFCFRSIDQKWKLWSFIIVGG